MARDSEEIFIAGGAGIYREAMSLCTSAEITRVPGVHPCDAFMPKLDKNGWWIDRIETTSGLQVEHWKRKHDA